MTARAGHTAEINRATFGQLVEKHTQMVRVVSEL